MNIPVNFRPVVPSDLRIKKFRWRDLSEPVEKRIIGYDTETLDGYCHLIAASNGTYRETAGIDPILDFLTGRKFRTTHGLWYNMDYDIRGILKYLSHAELKQIWDKHRLKYGKYQLKYIPKKLFVIKVGSHSYKHYDVSQFYNGSLAKMSSIVLHEKKNPDNLDRKLIGNSPQYWIDNHDNIIKYCILDARLCARLGNYLQKSFVDNMQLIPRTYVSKASIAKDYFRQMVKMPTLYGIDRRILNMSLLCYNGGRFENMIKGNNGKCWSYDLRSAYPYAMTLLPDINHGKWKHVHEHNYEALLGYYMVKTRIPFRHMAPLSFRYNRAILFYPVGSFYTWLTNSEIALYGKYIDIDVIEGWEFYDNDPVYPFKEVVKKLFEIKQSSDKSSFHYKNTKIIMNSIYGCFYEKHGNTKPMTVGKIYNPMYASWITAKCRCMVFDICRDNMQNVVQIATDSVVFNRDIPIKCGDKLGDWALEASGDTIVIRSGLTKIGDLIKQRGIRRMFDIHTPHGWYDNLFAYMEDKPELTEYTIMNERPRGIGECLKNYKKLSIVDINRFQEVPYTININDDPKRVWDSTFENGGDLLSRAIRSMPMKV